MSKLEDKAFEYLDKVEELANKYTPDVIDATLGVVQIGGIKGIITGLIGLIVGAVCGFAAYRYLKTVNNNNVNEIGVIFFGLISLVALIVGVAGFFDIWNWVAIIEPKLALANKIIGMK